MEYIIKIVKSLEESGLLTIGVKKIENEAKKPDDGFYSMLLGTLGVYLLGNLLAGRGVIRVGKETIRAGWDF